MRHLESEEKTWSISSAITLCVFKKIKGYPNDILSSFMYKTLIFKEYTPFIHMFNLINISRGVIIEKRLFILVVLKKKQYNNFLKYQNLESY